MKEIILSDNQKAFVDDEDFARINKFKWYPRREGKMTYAVRYRVINGVEEMIYMHDEVMKVK